MRQILPGLACLLMLVLCESQPGAQTTPQTSLDPVQVRIQFTDASADWPPVPRQLLLAFVAAEDRAFFDRLPQYSTITQQVAPWLLGPHANKTQKIAASFALAEALSHDEILTWYANAIYLGQACYGVTDAAQAYFAKTPNKLSLAEAALLAALPKAPLMFHPVKSPDRALARRTFVIDEMKKAGFVSDDEALAANATALQVQTPLGRCTSD